MRAEISGLTQGTRNAEHALDLLRTAEGGMNEISAILIRMREMAVQSSSATLNDNNRESLDAEFGQLKETIDRIVGLANYNEQALLRGFGNEVNATLSTAQTDAADTGVRRITLSAAKAGDYTLNRKRRRQRNHPRQRGHHPDDQSGFAHRRRGDCHRHHPDRQLRPARHQDHAGRR